MRDRVPGDLLHIAPRIMHKDGKSHDKLSIAQLIRMSTHPPSSGYSQAVMCLIATVPLGLTASGAEMS